MARKLLLYCPYCSAELEMAANAVEGAGGLVRCGSCLQQFNANESEPEFIAPRIDENAAAAALADIDVAPLETAELPADPRGIPWLSLSLASLLLVALGWQINNSLSERAAALPRLTLGRILVRPHPDYQQSLRLDAVLRNATAAPQPLPDLELSFQDGFGKTRARRRFQPGEYLQGSLRGRRDMPPRSELQIALELADPGAGTVNFSARLTRGTEAGE